MQWRNGWIFKIYNSTNTAIYPYDFKISSFPDFPSFQCYQNYSTQKNTGICAVLTKYSLGGWRYKDTFVLSCFSCVQLCETLRTAACQAPLSMGFSRREYYSGLPCPPPGDLPEPGMEPESLMSPALAGRFFTASTTWEAHSYHVVHTSP